MAVAEDRLSRPSEQTSLCTEIAARHDTSPWLSRKVVTNEVAAAWLRRHPEIHVTPVDLAKSLQQLLTETFQTGLQRRHDRLSAYANAMLSMVGTDAESFAPARCATVSADMARTDALTFARLAELLAPLAVAIQLSRIPVADTAARLLGNAHPGNPLTRRELRGFVVAQVRPHAQQLLARLGTGSSANDYLQLILHDVDELAESVVAAALHNQARPAVLSEEATERLNEFAKEQLPSLRRAAARYGQHADDILAMTMLKLTAGMRNSAPRCLDLAYARRAMANAANDFYNAAATKAVNEVTDVEQVERAGTCREDTAIVDAADVVLRHVLAAADRLEGEGDPAWARETLLRFFLADPAVVDRRRARLAAHVLNLSAPGASERDDEVRTGLQTVASNLTPSHPAARRVCKLALTALRAPIA